MAKRDRFQPRTVRRQENAVTHVLETTVLDAPQIAYERVCGAIEREACNLSPGGVERLVELVVPFALKLRRHRADSDEAGLLRGLVLALAEKLAVCSAELTRCAEAGK